MNGANPSSKDNFVTKAILFFSLAIIAFYLLTEHRAHLLAYSSYIIFFVFILMHLFMHSGHGEHGGHGGCGGHGQGKHKPIRKRSRKGMDRALEGTRIQASMNIARRITIYERYTSIWPLVSRHNQLIDLHYLCLQLHTS